MAYKASRVVVFALLGIFMASVVWAADVKIGVVDSFDVIFNSSEGKRAQDSLKRKGEELGRDLERRRTDLGKQVEDFQKQAAVMKEDALKRRQDDLMKKEEDLRRKLGASEQEFGQMRERELKPLFEKFDRVIKQIAQEGKYTIILDKRAAIGFDPGVDITEKVKNAFGR